MQKSLIVHLKNKYPGGKVDAHDDSIDAYDRDGRHRVALRKNGAGQMVDCGDQVGALDAFSLEPLPKDARAFKLFKTGKIAPSEEYDERIKVATELADRFDGKVPSQVELEKADAGDESSEESVEVEGEESEPKKKKKRSK